MKTLKNTLLIGLMTLLLSPLSFAQDFDANRMNRDIKIMENILDELFKTDISGPSVKGSTRIMSFGGTSSGTTGAYIPNYGIIFRVPHIISAAQIASVSVDQNSKDSKITFYYNSDEGSSDKGISEEAVVNRISEFLRDYASAITQLQSDENIMVIYGSKGGSNMPVYFSIRGDRKVSELPIVSVSAKKRDIDAYRNGKINDSSFKDRVKVSETNNSDHLDLKVMGNILETAFGESSNEMFQISGKPAYLALDNFGVLFTMNVRHNRTSAMGSIVFHDDEVRNVVRASGIQKLDVLSPEEAEEKRAEQAEQAHASFEQLKIDVMDYLIDYGRTLSSVSSDEFILLTINILSNRWDDEIPSRLDIQLKKSVLERLERGAISRNEAINAVTITEY